MNVTSALLFDPNVTGHHDQQDGLRGDVSKEQWQAINENWLARRDTLTKVGLPVILAVGTFSNTMAILVLRKMLSDQSGFPLLFMALAVTDLVLLYTEGLSKWVSIQFGADIKSINIASCKVISWLQHSFLSLSSWLLAAMTVQRALSIVCPLWMRRVRPRKQALVTSAVLTALSLAVNSPFLFMRNITPCKGYMTTDVSAYIPLAWYLFVLNCAVPFTVLLVCNTLMIRTAMVRSRRRVSTRLGEQGAGNQENNVTSRVTSTLILVSVAFIVLTLPFYVWTLIFLKIYNTAIKELWWSLGPMSFCAQIFELLLLTNSAINFFLYALTGTRFRVEMKSMLCTVMTVCSKTRRTKQPEQRELTDSQSLGTLISPISSKTRDPISE